MGDEQRPLLTARQAAARVGLPITTFRRAVGRGDVPHVRLTNGRIWFEERDLDEWKRRQRVEARTSHEHQSWMPRVRRFS